MREEGEGNKQATGEPMKRGDDDDILDLPKGTKVDKFPLFNLHPIQWGQRSGWLGEDEWGMAWVIFPLREMRKGERL
jgi:hypothetical protein